MLAVVTSLVAQESLPADELDPARDASRLTQPWRATPLIEQYIWTQGENSATGAKDVQWVFRRTITLDAIPKNATLYVAASGDVDVWVNGSQILAYLDDRTQRPGYVVHALDARPALRQGNNVLAIRVRSLHGAHHTTTDAMTLQFTGGRAIAVKLLPAGRGVEAVPLLVSDAAWRGRSISGPQSDADDMASISTAQYDGTQWPAVAPLGGIESNVAFYQWNSDAGMYAWPGYVGASQFLRHYYLRAMQAVDEYAGSATIQHLDRLTKAPEEGDPPFTVQLSPLAATEQSPALMLDFGREVTGRIHLRSASDAPILVSTSYGESREEALDQPYLGLRTVYVSPHGEAWGPKSGFRFVRVQFQTDAQLTAVDLDGIAYPVEYKGSFLSPDPLLNRVWQTGAYTAHLCMQDGIWDGVKRDRARWAGDLDVTGRVINDVFADRALLEDTYARLLEEAGSVRPVNGIAGYSALWVTGFADFYRHTGDHDFLLRMHQGLLALLRTMDRDIGSDGLFMPAKGEHVFVDWSPGLNEDTPEARRATTFEYVLAYREAAWLLDEAGDGAMAAAYKVRYDALRTSTQKLLRKGSTHTFGSTWQTNAMAVLAGVVTEADYPELWRTVFSNIDRVTDTSPRISPYYGYYVLEAMAQLGHRSEALSWLRDFWGGMIAEGATSFWESYDPRWTKRDFHAGLQADGLAGYYVSLAHGWSSGPTAWLLEQLLGVRATSAGFRTLTIEPELAGMPWIEGSVPVPGGALHLRAESGKIELDLPANVAATMLVRASNNSKIRVNGLPSISHPASASGYRSLQIARPGHYVIVVQ
jgi:hypothetical protein